MQTGVNLSSSQSFQYSSISYAATQLSLNQKTATEEVTNNQANVVPDSTINQDGGGRTSNVLSSSTLLGNNLSDFQKNVLNQAMTKIAEVKDEMLSIWDKLFPNSNSNSLNIQSGSFSIETLMNLQLQRTGFSLGGSGSGISVSQGFSRSLEISMQGTIVANDGTTKKLEISIGISQSFVQNLQLNTNAQNTQNTQESNKKIIDPLVIDYDGSGTELSDTKMRFDLDSDGTPDQIATLKKGSGFLALDKNNDGKINDGSELFGTKSGDGFKDLSQYDSNGDGKIDKDDPIYDKLRIWTPDANGEGQLVGLGEKGIGVIYLDAQESKEMMKGDNGDLLGIKQKTADFLYDNGSTGQIHHIDLVSEKIKDEALQNQAQNDTILSSGQSVAQILAGRAYQGLEIGLSNQSFAQANNAGVFGTNGILNGILENSGLNSAQFSSLEINISVSFSSLQSGSNGISLEVSQMWAKLESSFNTIETSNFQNNKEKNNLVDSLLMGRYEEMNRFIFNPFNFGEDTNTFKESLLSSSLKKLLSA